MNWYMEVLRKYAVFSGRSRRTEYWMFVLFNLIISVVLGFLDRMTGLLQDNGIGVLGGLYSLAVLIPSIAVSIRRLHDTGRSGWWLLLAFIPLIGGIVLIVFMAQDGEPQPNQYGPNPKMAVSTV